MDLVWIIVALLVGLVIGGGLAYLVMRRRYGDRESIVQLRNEFDQYRNKVTEHFVDTADLVNTLTRNYKNVYEHLEEGAYELVGEETLRKRLDTVDEPPVMIEYLGQRRTEQPKEADAAGGPKPKPPADKTTRAPEEEKKTLAGERVSAETGKTDAPENAASDRDDRATSGGTPNGASGTERTDHAVSDRNDTDDGAKKTAG